MTLDDDLSAINFVSGDNDETAGVRAYVLIFSWGQPHRLSTVRAGTFAAKRNPLVRLSRP